MDSKKVLEGAGAAALTYGVTAATEPAKIKGGEVSQEFKDNKLNQRFYKGYGFLDGTMPMVDPLSIKQRAASGVAGGLMKLLSGLVSDPAEKTINPLEELSKSLSSKVGGMSFPDMNTPLTPSSGVSGSTGGLESMISKMAEQFGVNPMLAVSLAGAESSFNRSAVSKKGARGLFQLMPDTANEVAGRELSDDELNNPELNAELGLKYYSQMKKMFGTDEKAIAAYNWGPENIKPLVKYSGSAFLEKLPTETRNHVKKVLGSLSESQGGVLG